MTPGECPDELKVVQIGDGLKSYCGPWERYTNCREVGHCVYADVFPGENQMTIFDVLEDRCDSR